MDSGLLSWLGKRWRGGVVNCAEPAPLLLLTVRALRLDEHICYHRSYLHALTILDLVEQS